MSRKDDGNEPVSEVGEKDLVEEEREEKGGGCFGGGDEEPFDADQWRSQTRSCTDLPVLIVFLVCVAGWIALAGVAFSEGDPARLLRGTDFNGNVCGRSAGVEQLPFEFVPDPRHTAYSLCVGACPVTVGQTVRSVNTAHTPPTELNATNVYGRTYEELYHCLPVQTQNAAQSVLGAATNASSAMAAATLNLPASATYMKELSLSMDELANSWPAMLVTVLLVFALYFPVILLLKWLAGPIVYGTVVLVLVLLICAGFFCRWSADSSRQAACGNKGSDPPPLVHSGTNALVNADPINSSQPVWAGWGSLPLELRPCQATWAVTGWETLAVIFWILAGVYAVLLVWIIKKLATAVEVIRLAATAVVSMPTTVIVPVLSAILLGLVTAWSFAIALYLHSSGSHDSVPPAQHPAVLNVQHNQTGSNLTNSTALLWVWDDALAHSQLVNVFMFYWVLNHINGLCFMVLAVMFSGWYFSKNQPPDREEVEKEPQSMIGSLCTVTMNHLGTVAFGSLLIGIVQFIRYVFNKLHDSIADGGMIACLFRCCINCILSCIERTVQYLSEMVYIVTAIHGYGFCRSMGRALSVGLRNVGELLVVNYVSDLVFVLMRISVAAASVFLLRALAQSNLVVDTTRIKTLLLPSVLTFVLVYVVGGVFVQVYKVGIDTLFMCYLEDIDALNQAADKQKHSRKRLYAPLAMQQLVPNLPKSKAGPSSEE
eukprot:TRINITY_DN4194_c6_g1_i1.p1 TRINITY_DN4194_c6_g1~~TRINITY_DN4194_c6_g1_i1.p1  ORF type:complete len:713 (+),score=119.38 TRINITY_DN4194_c6_g1_i1:110-2248(+)